MFSLARPSLAQIARFVDRSRELPLSYAPIGLAQRADRGFTVNEERAIVGRGEAAFARAKTALAEWAHFELDWIELFPRRASIAPGTVVAVLAHHLGFWSLNGCRVVYAVEAGRTAVFGFAYGTLAGHAESGEELFEVSLNSHTGDVSYRIRAVSRPRAPLARLGYPVASRLQRRFRRDSARALTRAVRGGGHEY